MGMKIEIDTAYDKFFIRGQHFIKGCFVFLSKEGKWMTKEEIEKSPEFRFLRNPVTESEKSPWFWNTKQEAEACLIQTLGPEELAEYIAQKLSQ